jgi:hypothetical protein
MDLWDWILALWWLLAVVVAAMTVHFTRRGRRIDSRGAFRASLQPNSVGRYGGYWMSESRLPNPLSVIYVLGWIMLAVGFVALLWDGYANPRTMANMFAFVILFGLMLVATGLSASTLSQSDNKWMKSNATWLRPVLALAGIGMIGYAGHVLFEDMATPGTFVEGRITRLSTDFGVRRGPRYWAYIGGHPFMITHDVQSQLAVGQWVRAERTAGSDVIVAAAVVPPPARPAR